MNNAPTVSVVMGSTSDLDTMKQATAVLESFGVPYETRIISAHRTPAKAHEYGTGAKQRGTKVIIAGAGKAAHLAGVLASLTTIPVIGVPMKTSDLGGMDSLLSTVQMPGGIPVATTAIGSAGAKNAALLAIRILALADDSLAQALETYRETMRQQVEADDQKVRTA